MSGCVISSVKPNRILVFQKHRPSKICMGPTNVEPTEFQSSTLAFRSHNTQEDQNVRTMQDWILVPKTISEVPNLSCFRIDDDPFLRWSKWKWKCYIDARKRTVLSSDRKIHSVNQDFFFFTFPRTTNQPQLWYKILCNNSWVDLG